MAIKQILENPEQKHINPELKQGVKGNEKPSQPGLAEEFKQAVGELKEDTKEVFKRIRSLKKRVHSAKDKAIQGKLELETGVKFEQDLPDEKKSSQIIDFNLAANTNIPAQGFAEMSLEEIKRGNKEEHNKLAEALKGFGHEIKESIIAGRIVKDEQSELVKHNLKDSIKEGIESKFDHVSESLHELKNKIKFKSHDAAEAFKQAAKDIGNSLIEGRIVHSTDTKEHTGAPELLAPTKTPVSPEKAASNREQSRA